MPESSLDAIRERTKSVHAELETVIDERGLLNSLSGAIVHLSTLLFHHRRVARYIEHPGLHALVLDRVEELEFDLARLSGHAMAEVAGSNEAALSLPGSLGAVYVIEGSRLGSMVVAKRLRNNGVPTEGLRSLGGDPQAVRARWRSFAERLDTLPADTWQDAASAAYDSFTELLESYQLLARVPSPGDA